MKAFDSVSRRTDFEQHLRVVSGFLQRSVEQGYPLALVNRRGWRLLFEGDASSLRYVANLPGFLGYGGLYEMIFRTDHQQGQMRMILERRPLFIDKARGEFRGELEQQILMDDLRELRGGRGSISWKQQLRRDLRELCRLVRETENLVELARGRDEQ